MSNYLSDLTFDNDSDDNPTDPTIFLKPGVWRVY